VFDGRDAELQPHAGPLRSRQETALAGIDEIYDPAAQASRQREKAQLPGSGGLRDKVLGRLGDHPSASITQHEIHKVLSHSFVTIASAVDTSVKLGDAGLAGEKPVSSASSAPAAESAQVGGVGRD